MSEPMTIVSDWTRQIESGEKPSSLALKDHLNTVHDNNTGFTEACAWNCRDVDGKNSYELLVDVIDQKCHSNVLDLGCGSGVLLDLCNQRFGSKLELSGIDMSNAELELARHRLANTDIKLYHGMAQELNFIENSSFDVILCHWALTLMDPLTPVFAMIKRILKNNGIFAAIIDGDPETAPAYLEVHNIIYKYVQQDYPDYGVVDLGDPRARSAGSLEKLAIETFDNADIKITPALLNLNDTPNILAREAAGFFYATFVLSEIAYNHMLNELENYFTTLIDIETSCFTMPVNKLVIRQD